MEIIIDGKYISKEVLNNWKKKEHLRLLKIWELNLRKN